MTYSKLFLTVALLLTSQAYAATRVDLNKTTLNQIKPYLQSVNSGLTSNDSWLKKISMHTDSRQITHIRLQQMYHEIPVWRGTSVLHLPKMNKQIGLLANINIRSKINGAIYDGLDGDLANASVSILLSDTQKQNALKKAKAQYEQSNGVAGFKYEQETTNPIIFIDNTQTAHYAFLVSFYTDDGTTGAHRPTAIIDAETLEVFQSWDGVKNHNLMENNLVLAGGVGGNPKSGELIYDGAEGHLPPVKLRRIYLTDEPLLPTFTLFSLANEDVTVYDMSYATPTSALFLNRSINPDPNHNNVYWLSQEANETRWKDDEVNEGYSPSLDALYSATIVKNFYQDWYGVPALVEEDGVTPMMLVMRVHYGRNFDNAFWDGKQMTFGDGGTLFYPLTSLSIAAHEISHGFTEQHASLVAYEPQMAALHEAFSDEAAVAMQYYATGKVTWEIGREVTKADGALRYLNDPKIDGRSIDNLKDFDNTEPHAAAGIFNKAFYLIATSNQWDVRKAFNVMVSANMNYWTSSMSTFTEAACGVMAATADYGYSIQDVSSAFSQVGIDIQGCNL